MKNIYLDFIGCLILPLNFYNATYIDLKPFPLYEEEELALMKTHYYGAIKKYQWTAIPLALHGVITKKTGKKLKS